MLTARVFLLAACALGASALPFRVASLFSSGMVLQRDAPASAWGWSTPGSTVFGALINSATNATLLSSGVADASGGWSVPFPAQPKSGGVYRLLLTTSPIDEQRCDLFQFYCSGASISFSGIAFGDLLLGIGQSNMQASVAMRSAAICGDLRRARATSAHPAAARSRATSARPVAAAEAADLTFLLLLLVCACCLLAVCRSLSSRLCVC
jgi:hypothetical protein